MYLGINLCKQYAQVAVMDLESEIVEEVHVKNANLDDLTQRYADSRAITEATSNYYHAYDILTEYLDVTVVHPGKLTLITRSDRKTDRVDAEELVRLPRLNSIPQSYVPIGEIREVHALMRGRQTLVEGRTKFANKIHGLLTDNGITQTVKPLSVEG